MKSMSFNEFLASCNSNVSQNVLSTIDDFNKNAQEFFQIMKSIHNYLTNPILIWQGLMHYSYWICLMVCISCILIYIINKSKKTLQTGATSFGIYIILSILNKCIVG